MSDFNNNDKVDIGDGQYIYTYHQSNNTNYIDASNTTIMDAYNVANSSSAIPVLFNSFVFLSTPVPNWMQPTYYGQAQYNAWCSPTSAANQLGHLVDSGVLNQPSLLNDGFIAGNEIPIASQASTIPWDSSHGWGDYLIDGPSHRGKNNPPNLTDFGWYMNTNNLTSQPYSNGVNVMSNPVGTTINNIYYGLVGFYQEAGWNDIVGMAYHKNQPSFIGANNNTDFPEYWKQNGYDSSIAFDHDIIFNTIKHEIDNNRSVIACFGGWFITNIASYGTLNYDNKEAVYYKFGQFNPTASETGEYYDNPENVSELGNVL